MTPSTTIQSPSSTMTRHTLAKVAALAAFTAISVSHAPATLVAQSATAPVRSESAAQLRARLNAVAANFGAFGFSGSLFAIKGDTALLDVQFGMADRESKRANSGSTLFNTGSLTKQFTGAAILKLEMAGKLKVTDSLGKFFPNTPADKRGITLHHLLTHTSGLPETNGGDEWPTRDAAVREIFALPMESTPGAEMRYANAGYNLLGAVVEIASGMTYDRFLREQLFTPAGMTSTGWSVNADQQSRLASYYMGEIPNGTTMDFREGREWALMGAGGVLTTSDDMRKWVAALGSNRILNAAERTKLFTPARSNYAYGWAVFNGNAGTLIEHDGGNTLGVGAFVLWYRDANVVVIGFCNDDGETTLLGRNGVRRHIRTILEGGSAPAMPVVGRASGAIRQNLVGTYRGEGNEVSITNADGQTRVTGIGQRVFAALASLDVADSAFVAANGAKAIAGIAAAMRGDSAGATSAFIPRASGRLVQFGRAAQQEFGAFRSADILGARRESEGDDMTLHVRMNFANGAQYLRARVMPRGMAGLDFLRRPPSVPAAVVNQNELAVYAWGSGGLTRMRLEGTQLVVERDGIVTRLVRQ